MQDLPRDPALDGLEPLVGEWDVESTHPMIEGPFRGRATFEWLPGRRFLVWRSGPETPDTTPSAIAIIGGGDTPGTWPMHYFDSRGVTRLYQTTVTDGIWRVWRDDPGFSQRSTGIFSDGGRTLRVDGELQQDGPWKPDLQSTYRRR